MFEEGKSGMGWVGVLFIILIVWLLFGGGLGNGVGGRGNCERVSHCEIEKQEIIDAARTQFMVESTARNTQEYLGTKIDFYEYQNLRDALAAERAKNSALESRIYSDAQFNALSRQLEAANCSVEHRLDGIECRMLTKPALYGVAATCSGQIIPPITTTAAG
jgi:hypothetical protein